MSIGFIFFPVKAGSRYYRIFSISAPLAVTGGQRNTAAPSKDQLGKCLNSFEK